jgi:hypothetical protein
MFLLGAHLTDTMATKVVSLAPSVFRSAISSREQNKSFPIIWDSSASVCITPDKSDFVTYDNDADITKVKGLGGKVSAIVGQGEVDWSIHDVHGCLRHLRLKAYHIPKCSTRLISTNILLNTYKGEQVQLMLSPFISAVLKMIQITLQCLCSTIHHPIFQQLQHIGYLHAHVEFNIFD